VERHIPITDVKNRLAEIINYVAYGKDTVFVTRRGKDMVALVSIEEAKQIKKAKQNIGNRPTNEKEKAFLSLQEMEPFTMEQNPTDVLRTMREREIKTLIEEYGE